MTPNKRNHSKKKTFTPKKLSPQASLPLRAKRESDSSPQSKLVFQLKSELARHQKRDREWKLLFNMLAHDLKEPLLTLEGFTQLLVETSPQTKDQKKYIKIVREAVGSLHLLIGSLQSITKLYQEPTDRVDISLKQIVDSVITALAEQIRKNKGKVIAPTEDAIIKADPARLYQILLNLVANSLKYHRTDVSPEIKIRYSHSKEFHKISIEDNGIGIDQKDMERIFMPFTRLEEVMADGLGLGLSIVKKIAETCGGKISVKSEHQKGTVFTIYLPKTFIEEKK